jgi:FG-GAP repeat/FlgD Ig-like domain
MQSAFGWRDYMVRVRSMTPDAKISASVFLKAAVLGFLLMMVHSPAHAQYMYLDINGDGINDGSDVLTEDATAIDVWVDTDTNRDGSPAACDAGPEPLTINSYEFFLHAAGALTYGAWADNMAFPTTFGDIVLGSEAYFGRGGATILPPGLYKLGTLSVSAVGKHTTLTIVATSSVYPPTTTSFGTQCAGIDLDNTYKLGSDWFDVAGLFPFPNNSPTITAPSISSGMEGETVSFGVAAADADGDHVVLTASGSGITAGGVFTDTGGASAGGSGVFNWMVGQMAAGESPYRVSFTGDDGFGGVSSETTEIAVQAYQMLVPDGGEQWVAGRAASVRWLGAAPADLAISHDGGSTWNTVASGVGGLLQNEYTVIAPSATTEFAMVRLSYTGQPVTATGSDRSNGVFSIVAPSKPPGAAFRTQLVLEGASPVEVFGSSVSSAGDVNGDGYADIIVGAYGNDIGGVAAGQAYVYYGGPGMDAVPDLTFTGAAGVALGDAVSGAGDVNGDGYADVIVGAPQGAANAGQAHVYFGGPGADSIADLTMTGEAPFDFFGSAVSGAGDVNGDGFEDVIVGAFGATAGMNVGRAYVYFGGLGADGIADLTLTGISAPSLFGVSVSGAGDVNGDGYADLIVGADRNSAGGAYAGAAYLYYGGPGADTVPDLTLIGEASQNFFGGSVSSAGDINGDGYSDVIVGAAANSSVSPLAGRAYVYFGGPDMDTVADLTLTGAPGEQLGSSVSGAGDVNADGFSDVIVGAVANDGPGTNVGRSYVFYGGPGADTRADLGFSGAASDLLFGWTVSDAGDVNGDGAGDVIIGTMQDYSGSQPGRAYLYDCRRYFVKNPSGGETWNVGAIKTIRWQGAEPADVWLATDGGDGDELLASHVGGAASNAISVRVPHFPTKFARVVIRPSDGVTRGEGRSDSLFTIQSSVALLSMLAAPLSDGGALISWETNPGPQELSGYRVDRSSAGQPEWRTLVTLTQATSVTDPEGGPGSKYRLFAVNGFGEDLWLGEASIRPRVPLSAWPLPYRGGTLAISFATVGGLGGGLASADVALYDVSGRLVRTIASEFYTAGYHSVIWDGRDGRGGHVAAGIYFLRARSGGEERTIRVAVLN